MAALNSLAHLLKKKVTLITRDYLCLNCWVKLKGSLKQETMY